MKFFREPLVHFLCIGAAIYLLYGMFAEPAMEETDKTIVVSAGEIEWMQTSWEKRWTRPPTAKELDGLIQGWGADLELIDQALHRGAFLAAAEEREVAEVLQCLDGGVDLDAQHRHQGLLLAVPGEQLDACVHRCTG